MPLLRSWYGEGDVFAQSATDAEPTGIEGFSRNSDERSAAHSTDIPVLNYTLYNAVAYEHIRRNHLYVRGELSHLLGTGEMDSEVKEDRTIPAFPSQAMVLKTAWWPVAPHGTTPLPVWDPEQNAARTGGNDYTTWQRVVAVHGPSESQPAALADIDFAGTSFRGAHSVSASEFIYLSVDTRLAQRLNRDSSAVKIGLMVLGRQIAAGDYLVLVAANLATKEIDDWVWATVWWHDRAEETVFAADRPVTLAGAARHYLLQVAFDEEKPIEKDGGPHICFNPWLEARFPDGGQGSGVVGNCMACHRRASYPPVDFLPVTRGVADLLNDPAYAAGRLRTGFLWSIAMHSVP